MRGKIRCVTRSRENFVTYRPIGYRSFAWLSHYWSAPAQGTEFGSGAAIGLILKFLILTSYG